MANGIAITLSSYLSDDKTSLPSPLSAELLTQQIAAWLSHTEGATFNLYFGNMANESLYAVSLYPERSVVFANNSVPEHLLRRFITDNLDLLADPRNSIGIWYSEALNSVYLDISATLPDRLEAVSLGEWYNQEAIYDLAGNEVIDTGGSGEDRGGWALETERLPPLLLRKNRL